LLIARTCGADSDLIAATPDQRPALAKAAALFSEEDLTRFFQILLQTDDDLRRKPDARVHLEMGLLRLINAQRLAPMEELMAELRSGAPAGVASAGGMRSSASAASAMAAPQAAPATRSFPSAPAPQTTFSPAARSSPPSFSPAAAAAAPARAEIKAAPVPTPAREEIKAAQPAAPPATVVPASKSESEAEEVVATPSAARAEGITQEQVAEIKTAIQAQQKFLGEIMNQGSRWELEGAELRIYFSADKRAFAEMMEGRDSLEKVRASSSKVLGRPVRVCAKVEAVAANAPRGISGTQELREQFERDPMVRSMLQRFGGKISEVKWRQEES
jgi:DNA polymerase III subunit gamma/tau